jgi:serine-type D-Ala-D-Ala carboxypeptidase/endopeptidase (penicillin-binding protein 4)
MSSMRRALPVLLLLLAAPAPTAAADLAATQRALAAEMARVGAASGAYVRDLDDDRTLFDRRAAVPRIPASVQKLLTTSAALRELGPDATLRTTVLGAGALDEQGVWRGDLVLRGGGDPTLQTAGLEALAEAVAQGAIVRVDGSVLGDETGFDALRGASRTGGAYDPDMGGVLSALAVGRGFTRDGRPALEAAKRFAKALREAGVAVSGRTGVGPAPEGAPELAVLASPPLERLVAEINVPSNNFASDMLLKALGARAGAGGSTAAGAAVVARELREQGVQARVADGSGLARANRVAPREVVDLLDAMEEDTTNGPAFLASLPVAGRTGTLRTRMRGTAAAARCRAKTGTIRAVSALAGICTTRDGGAVAFAFMMNGASTWAARRAQDRMTAALARYDGSSAAG